MSANNYILVKQLEKNKWIIAEKDIETDRGGITKETKTLEEALDIAEEVEYDANEYGYGIEYGIRIERLPKVPAK